ncbi:glycosyltransferase family 4 protein [Chloroflexota bacterium]
MSKKICFVSLSSYPILVEKNMGTAGGAEVQQVFLAKELVKRNHEVSFITYSDGQASIEYIEGIKVIKVYKRENVLNLTLLAKAWHIWKAMREADADIYFHRGKIAAGLVPLSSCLRRRKFVYCVSSDGIVSKNSYFVDNKWYQKYAEWLDIKLAHVVIAQNEFQRKLLRENFKRESIIIKNAFLVAAEAMPEKKDPPIILWVASIRELKQPELFFKLADAIPEANFQMIGGPSYNLQSYDEIKESATKIPNLQFLGFIPFYKVNQYFKQASIFVNTSKFEGFPNTFIQAWQQYVPTVSLIVDPDEVIRINRLGFCSKTFSQLVEDVKKLLKNKPLRQEMGENARRYVEKEHDVKRVVKQYIEVFKRL